MTTVYRLSPNISWFSQVLTGMPTDSQAYQLVIRFHNVVSCAVNMEDLISNKSVHSVRQQEFTMFFSVNLCKRASDFWAHHTHTMARSFQPVKLEFYKGSRWRGICKRDYVSKQFLKHRVWRGTDSATDNVPHYIQVYPLPVCVWIVLWEKKKSLIRITLHLIFKISVTIGQKAVSCTETRRHFSKRNNELCKQNQQDAPFFSCIYSIIFISTLHVSSRPG